MKFPTWAAAAHPIVQRETVIWRRSLKKWRWAASVLLLLPCTCSALCAFTGLPAAFSTDSPGWAGIIFLAWMAIVAVWITGGLWGWALTIFANIGSAIVIARERETQNWQLLRLTTLSIPEIIGAKVAALLRLLVWPTALVLALEMVGTGLLVAVALGLIFLSGAFPTTPTAREVQVSLSVVAVAGAGPFLIYLSLIQIVGLLYNCAVGVLTSTLSRTSATAIALSFVVHFAINLFIFLPIQQILSFVLQILGASIFLNGAQASTPLSGVAPIAVLALTSLLPFILPILLQVGVAIVAFYLAVGQAQRIAE